jgi:DNA-binding NtrC family response regulator
LIFHLDDPVRHGRLLFGTGLVLPRFAAKGMAHWMRTKTLKEREKEHLTSVLAKTHWDLNKSARLLRIPVSQVRRKITEYGLTKPNPNGTDST